MKHLPFPLLLIVLLSSCRFIGGERITGDGRIVTQQRSTGSFNSVEVSGALEVHVRQDAANSVKIETDANLMEYIEIFTDGNTLVIKPRKRANLDPSKDLIVYVTAPSFRDIDISGASKIVGEGMISGSEPLDLHMSGAGEMSMQVSVPSLNADISGASTLMLKGKANDFTAEASGASEIKCIDLVTEKTLLDLSGASDAEVTVNRQLDADASGASSVTYRGNASVNQKVSGAGSVKKVS